ncbi:MAG: SUMF1/EgtB/PvdO family nonheme iron enzyme, partial [Desulfobacteraceae bacterium]|nr:SUMF1/EgtB/PvdO family nonheme iron enzyme [Desulfobacteraceae bacterium]
FFVTPGGPQYDDPNTEIQEEVLAQRTTTFVADYGLQVGINGDFAASAPGPRYEYQPRIVLGLAVSNGLQYSTDDGRPALTLPGDSRLGTAYIGQAPFPADIYNAIGADKMLVENGLPVDPSTWYPIGDSLDQNPRTSSGLSADGSKLIIIVIDGGQPGFSEGVTLPEMAEYLIEFGACTGLNLDGGGSSTMVFGDEFGPTIINYPSEAAGERIVSNHLGIFSNPTEISGMVYVPAGEFIMGSSDKDIETYLQMFIYRRPSRFANEKPQHTVYLDAFYIDEYEVTNAQYEEFMAATGHSAPPYWKDELFNQPAQPVMSVTWEDAKAYADWVGKRLPTEAEWEKAARGTDGRFWTWGSEWDASKLNANDVGTIEGFVYTSPVGSFPQGVSPYGVHDMAGNVWEWCEDWYDENYYSYSPKINPKGPASGDNHVLRGGDWSMNLDFTRCASRVGLSPGSMLTGFRCAKSP